MVDKGAAECKSVKHLLHAHTGVCSPEEARRAEELVLSAGTKFQRGYVGSSGSILTHLNIETET